MKPAMGPIELPLCECVWREQLERQAAENEAAIRAYRERHNSVSILGQCSCDTCITHASAIQRATARADQGAKG